jgi:hypothetical protein
VDFATMRARRSFAIAIAIAIAIALVEPDVFAHFGSSEAVNAALKALVDAAGVMKPPKATRRPRRKRTAA